MEYLDESGAVLKQETVKDAPLRQVLPLDGAASLRFAGSKLEIAELRSIRADESLPFEPNGTPCDALLLLTQAGDESLVAAPILKQLADYGLTVQVCYLNKADRDRKGEVMETLAALGILREPVFCDMNPPEKDTPEAGKKRYYAGEIRRIFTELLETYRPTVWFTDGLGAGQALSEKAALITEAVQKHYWLTEDGSVVLTVSEEETARFDDAYRLQSSQRLYRKQTARKVRMTLLTPDAAEPLFDGIAPDTFLTYASPTPLPTETPTPAPTIEPTPAPTETPQPTAEPTQPPTVSPTPQPTEAPTDAPLFMSEPQPAQTDSAPHPLLWLIVGGLVVLVTLLILVVKRRR